MDKYLCAIIIFIIILIDKQILHKVCCKLNYIFVSIIGFSDLGQVTLKNINPDRKRKKEEPQTLIYIYTSYVIDFNFF